MPNPFDWRAVLLAKHAQHVVLIHFPIALFTAGVMFDLLARGERRVVMESAAYLNLSFAATMVVPTIATGLLAWKYALDGIALKGLLLWHLLAAITAVLLIVASWWIHWRARKQGLLSLPGYRIGIEVLGVLFIAITAHLGGFLSGINS